MIAMDKSVCGKCLAFDRTPTAANKQEDDAVPATSQCPFQGHRLNVRASVRGCNTTRARVVAPLYEDTESV